MSPPEPLGTLERRLEAAEAAVAAMLATFERMSVGVALLDASGRVLAANAVVRGLCARRDGLVLGHDGRLGCARSRDRAKLAALLASAIAETHGGRGAIATVERTPGAPLALVVTALSRRDPVGVPTAMLLVADPGERTSPRPRALERLYGLTPAEARLGALLAGGASLRQATERLNVTINTVKTHLRALFDKTATRRQSELVRALERAAAFAPLHPFG